MQRNLFTRRVFINNQVYLYIKDCADVLDISISNFLPLISDSDLSEDKKMVLESAFNRIISAHFPEKKDCFQFTRVETLEACKESITKLYPIKRMFAEEMFMRKGADHGLTADEYIEQIDYPNELNKEKEKIALRKSINKKIMEYEKSLEEVFDKNLEAKFKEFGLEFQTLSILSNKGISFMTFIVGKGIFFWHEPEYIKDDIWEDSYIDDSSVIIPSFDYSEEKYELERAVDRDFRKFSVLDNILWVVQNVQAIDEWQDCIEFRKGGINVSINKMLIMKFISPINSPDEYLFEGVPGAKNSVYLTEKKYEE